MAKLLKTLAKEYEFENEQQYFEYIVQSLINGQRSQVRELFNQMKKEDKEEFLNNFLEVGNSYHEEVKSICIEELLT